MALSGAAIAATSATWFDGVVRGLHAPSLVTIGPVWAAIQISGGLAGWLAWTRTGATRAVRLWGWQLLIGALWIPAVFGLRSPALGLCVAVASIGLVVACLRAFARIGRAPLLLMIPTLLWTLYAAQLNARVVASALGLG